LVEVRGTHLSAHEIRQAAEEGALSLVNRGLTALPPEVTQLTSLRRLNLDYNALTALPPEIGQLTDLRTLGLFGNQLTVLPPEIGQLTVLQDLDLRQNQLTTLPPEIGQLADLQNLYLSYGQLTALPPEIGQLTALQYLDVSGNQLTALPRQLADLLTGTLAIRLDNNPLPDLITELAARGTDALAAYLRSLGDAVAQYEAKMLLVGEGTVGKTSLMAALRGAAFVEKRPTTHGIEIHTLALRHPVLDEEIMVRAWDFGGQEVYRVTHQFFFTQRALYLVVWNACQGQEHDEVEGWLRRIRLRVGGRSLALVVATHCDERHAELDYPRLKEQFPELLAGQLEVDNSSGHGIDGLRGAIAVQATRLPQMGQLIRQL
jgi:internalin A